MTFTITPIQETGVSVMLLIPIIFNLAIISTLGSKEEGSEMVRAALCEDIVGH